jgi:hypothetical protein
VTTEIRSLIVRQLGAALAAAWRRQHETVNDNANNRGGLLASESQLSQDYEDVYFTPKSTR